MSLSSCSCSWASGRVILWCVAVVLLVSLSVEAADQSLEKAGAGSSSANRPPTSCSS